MAKANNHITSLGTVRTFLKLGTCSGAVMTVVNRAYDHPMEAEERAVMPLAGGIAQQGYQCGMLWGASLAAGAEAYRRFGSGLEAERVAMTAAQRLVDTFRDRNKYINCLEITDTDWTNKRSMLKNFLKGGPITCMRKTAGFAHLAFKEIDAALSEGPAETSPCSSCTLSCAAKLAKRLGLSEAHAVMAAGFAGGIGLSGGACGALGAAVWINEMICGRENDAYSAVNARATAVIDAFLKHSDYKLECSEIVGEKFSSIDEHAAHVSRGGCSRIIETLARYIEDARQEKEGKESDIENVGVRAVGA